MTCTQRLVWYKIISNLDFDQKKKHLLAFEKPQMLHFDNINGEQDVKCLNFHWLF